MAKAKDIPGLTGDMRYAEAAAATVAVRAREVFDHREGVLDMSDIEGVHAMRVATRRLRAVLEVYGPCFPKHELRPVLAEVKELADALGARRDPDVELLALEQFAASVGPDERAGVEVFIERTRVEQEDGNARVAAALERIDRDDLQGRLEALVAAVGGVPGDDDEDDGPDEAPAALAEPAPEPEPYVPEPADPWSAPATERGEHPHGLGIADGAPPANVNGDTGW